MRLYRFLTRRYPLGFQRTAMIGPRWRDIGWRSRCWAVLPSLILIPVLVDWSFARSGGLASWGYVLAATVSGLVALPAFWLCFAATREPGALVAANPKGFHWGAVIEGFRTFVHIIFINGPLLRVFLRMIVSSLAFTMTNKCLTYYIIHYLERPDLRQYLLPFALLINLLFCPFWGLVAQWTSNTLDMTVSAGEHEYNRWMFRDLILNGRIDVLNPDVSKIVGLTEARKVAALAEVFDLPIAVHNARPTLLTAAHTHFIAASQTATRPQEHSGRHRLSHLWTYFNNTLVPENAVLRVPDTPGLGLDVNEAAVRKDAA